MYDKLGIDFYIEMTTKSAKCPIVGWCRPARCTTADQKNHYWRKMAGHPKCYHTVLAQWELEDSWKAN